MDQEPETAITMQRRRFLTGGISALAMAGAAALGMWRYLHWNVQMDVAQDFARDFFDNDPRESDIVTFLKDGGDLDFDLGGGNTLLIEAARLNNVTAIKLLVKHGADPSRRDLDGKSALTHAIDNSSRDAMDLLRQVMAK